MVASVDGLDDSKWTQSQYPHLVVISDPDAKLVSAVQVKHAGAGNRMQDVAAPTTFLIDKTGVVRWLFRPDTVMRRLSPQELLAAIEKNLAN